MLAASLFALLLTAPVDLSPPGEARLVRARTENGPLYVWEPASLPRRVVVYVHGYYDRVDEVWSEHHLAEQLVASGIDATVIIPEAPISARESVFWPSLSALIATAEKVIGRPLDREDIALVGHSGAVRTLREWTEEPGVRKIVLLDAMYGDPRAFRLWVEGSATRRLTIVSRATEVAALSFLLTLSRSARELRVTHERAHTSHMGIVTEGEVLPRIFAGL
jgi:hypothetical protein